MIFGPVSVARAEGAVLAHALKLKTMRLKKGHVLNLQDIENLQEENVAEVIVAQLEEGDIAENEAAEKIAAALIEHSISVGEPFTGRVNIHASSAGMFAVTKDVIDELNRIDPAITLATLSDETFVEAGRMVATVKIIPFAVTQAALAQALAVSDGASVLRLRPARRMKIAMISTQLPSLKPTTIDKTEHIFRARLSESGNHLSQHLKCPHQTDALAKTVSSLADEHDLVVIFGASAITDRQDVIPTALEQSGGVIEHFGMPVDPGNLLLLGHIGNTAVIGAPGCARSPAENGFDWVLQRLICGMDVDSAYISGLGVGGLLMEITARPQPREG